MQLRPDIALQRRAPVQFGEQAQTRGRHRLRLIQQAHLQLPGKGAWIVGAATAEQAEALARIVRPRRKASSKASKTSAGIAVGQSSRLRKQGLLQMVIRPGNCRRDARPVAWPACRPATSRPTSCQAALAHPVRQARRRIAVALAATRSRPATAVHARAAVRPGSSAAGPNAQPGSRISRSRIVALLGQQGPALASASSRRFRAAHRCGSR